MLNRSILKVTKFQLPPLNRLATVDKNILGAHHAPHPPCQIGLTQMFFHARTVTDLFLISFEFAPFGLYKNNQCISL